METPEGILCDTCKGLFRWKNRLETKRHELDFWFNFIHHPNYYSFLRSKNDECFICNWLWVKYIGELSSAKDDKVESCSIQFPIRCVLDYEHYTKAVKITFHVISGGSASTLDIRMTLIENKRSSLPLRELSTCPWSTLAPEIGSGRDLRTIQNWISSCEKNHQHCRLSISGSRPFFPTRVIDVRDCGQGIVRLRDKVSVELEHGIDRRLSHQGHRPRYPVYLTLSHRWSSEKPLKLLETTKDQFYRGMSLNELPRTFRHSVIGTWRLGYRYIWIDSLCIFQDSREDWQRESSVMADIYSHSHCNISAIGASHNPDHGGLFLRRRLPSRLLYPFILSKVSFETELEVIKGTWIVHNKSVWQNEIESAPLSSRGWVVQERFLSARVVHFSENQIHWECLESIGQGIDPHGKLSIPLPYQDNSETTDYKSSRLNLAEIKQWSDLKRRHELDTYNQHMHWGTVVSTYVACDLTKESDRFVAMSGMAKAFREATGDTYLAGLWKRLIHTDLLWETAASKGVGARRNNSYAPTWSWVSIVGGQVRLQIPRGNAPVVPTSLIRLVDARIVADPPNGDPMGSLRSAELDIECMLYYFRWLGRSKTLEIYLDPRRMNLYSKTGQDLKELRLDTSALVRRFNEAYKIEGVCFPACASNQGYGCGYNQFLLLEGDENSGFRRIGLVESGAIGKWISERSGKFSIITLI